MSLGLKIRTARKAKGLTQAQLGELVGVSRRVIIFYELNRTRPGDTMIESLEEVLGVNFDTFTFPEAAQSTLKLQASSIDYEQIVGRSIENEEFARFFGPIFDLSKRLPTGIFLLKTKTELKNFVKLRIFTKERQSSIGRG